MARQDALQGSLPLLIMTLLARRGPLHGYAIATRIEGMSDETLRVEEGSLYPALHRLEKQKSVASEWKVSGNKQRAKYYRLTAAGKRQLAQERSRWQQLTEAIGGVLEQAGKEAMS